MQLLIRGESLIPFNEFAIIVLSHHLFSSYSAFILKQIYVFLPGKAVAFNLDDSFVFAISSGSGVCWKSSHLALKVGHPPSTAP